MIPAVSDNLFIARKIIANFNAICIDNNTMQIFSKVKKKKIY